MQVREEITKTTVMVVKEQICADERALVVPLVKLPGTNGGICA